MATAYDAPRKTHVGVGDDIIEELRIRRSDKSARSVDIDEFEAAESLELPLAELFDMDLFVPVLPQQQDEFTCPSCFMVHHHSRLAGKDANGRPICADCVSTS